MLTKTPSFRQSLPRSGIAGGCRNPASMDGKPQVMTGLAVSSKLHSLSDRSHVPAWEREADRSRGLRHRTPLEVFSQKPWEQSQQEAQE